MNLELSVYVTLITLTAAYIPWKGHSGPVWRGGMGTFRRYGVRPMVYGFNAMGNGYGARGYGTISYGTRGFGAIGYGTTGYGAAGSSTRGFNFNRGPGWRRSYNTYNYYNNYRNRYRMGYSRDTDYRNYGDYLEDYFFDDDDDYDDDDYDRFMAFYGRSLSGKNRKGPWAWQRPLIKSVLKYRTPFFVQKKSVPKWRPQIRYPKWRPQIRYPKWRPQIRYPKW